MNRIAFLFHCILLETLMNHWWRGAEASFRTSDIVAVIWGIDLIFLISFARVALVIKMAEAIDWMMK